MTCQHCGNPDVAWNLDPSKDLIYGVCGVCDWTYYIFLASDPAQRPAIPRSGP